MAYTKRLCTVWPLGIWMARNMLIARVNFSQMLHGNICLHLHDVGIHTFGSSGFELICCNGFNPWQWILLAHILWNVILILVPPSNCLGNWKDMAYNLNQSPFHKDIVPSCTNKPSLLKWRTWCQQTRWTLGCLVRTSVVLTIVWWTCKPLFKNVQLNTKHNIK